MVFYKGAISWETLNEMPYPEIIDLMQDAHRINTEKEAAIERQSGKRQDFI
jgi:hypothetical protein